MSKNSFPEFLNTRMASKECGLSIREIQKLIQDGDLKSRRFGKMYLIERRIWEEFKARNFKAS